MPLIPGPSSAAGIMLVDQPPAKVAQITATTTTPAVSFSGPNAPQLWYVDRITVKARAGIQNAAFPASSSQAFAYVGTDASSAVDDRNLADLTLVGNLDIADENAPILVDNGQVLVLAWTNATVGAIYTARIQYRLMSRS